MFSVFQLNMALLFAISSGLREFLRAFKDGTMGNIINNNSNTSKYNSLFISD